MHEPLDVKTLEEAKSEFSNYWTPARKVERISLFEAGGRILATDVKSKVDLPPFTRSVYDGFAVRAEDTFGAGEENPVTLQNIGRVLAGQVFKKKVEEAECVEISTGAPLPEGANSVVMVEDITTSGEGKIEVRRAVSPGENVSQSGSELKKGEKVASKGQRLTPQLHGALFACGIEELEVFARPKVGIISSGEELVEVGSEIELGQIYDVNGPAISDAVRNCGGDPEYFGIVKDDFEMIEERIKAALEKCDLVITSGGSSAGASDIVPEVIDSLGEPGVIVHGLAQKPGKPTILALIGEKPVFGLPGYPVSALMEFDQLVASYIRELAGESEPDLMEVKAKLSRKILSARGRRELVPVSLEKNEEELFAVPLREGSGAITSLARADGYTVISIEREIVSENELVIVNLFGGSELG